MIRSVHRTGPVVLGCALVMAACSTPGSADPAASGSLPTGDTPVDLDPATFSADITHPYWPMTPGTQWTYRETDGHGGEFTVTVTATDRTRQIADGVTARVVRDTVADAASGDIVEDTVDWYAQAADGTVWYFGEDTAEFENGEITSTDGSFEAGVDGALPGVLLPADPQPGMTYRQEFSRGVAEDNGAVLSTGELAEAPYGSFSDVLLTRDTIAIEPDVEELKFYAPTVGPVLAVDVSGGAGREELVSVEQVPAGTATGPLGTP